MGALNYYLPFIVGGVAIVAFYRMSIYYFFKKKIYMYPGEGWLKIDEHPIPDNLEEILVTNGENVKTSLFRYYNREGKVLFSTFPDSLITHWQPFPEAPK